MSNGTQWAMKSKKGIVFKGIFFLGIIVGSAALLFLDRPSVQSAALLVVDDRPFAYVDLRVDVHEEPVGELLRVFDAYRPAIPYYNLR